MKNLRIQMSTVSFLSAFVTGVILFAMVWKTFFGFASGSIVLAGMIGVLTAVIVLWVNQHKKSKP